MGNDANDPSTVKSALRALEIIESLRDQDGVRVSELAQELDLAKSTVHRYLTTLVQKEYVVKQGDVYCLSFRFLELSNYLRTRNKAFVKAEENVATLAEETGERVQFVVEERGKGVFIFTQRGEMWDREGSRVGHRVYLHTSGSGKAILASLPEHRVEEIVDEHGLPRMTENTITDMSSLKAELETIRDRGYAFNEEENLQGLRSVGVPIVDGHGNTVGGLSVSGPMRRLKGDWYKKEIPELTLKAANEVQLHHHDRSTH